MQLRDDPSEQAGTIPSETGDKEAPDAHEQQKTGEPRGEQLLGRGDAAKTEAIHKGLAGSDDTQGASASEKPQNGNAHETKAQGQGTEKKTKGDDGGPAFTKREREEMEALLQQLCGHLGMLILLLSLKLLLLTVVRSQWYIQLDSWKVKTWRTISCSTRTGYFPCLFMINFFAIRSFICFQPHCSLSFWTLFRHHFSCPPSLPMRLNPLIGLRLAEQKQTLLYLTSPPILSSHPLSSPLFLHILLPSLFSRQSFHSRSFVPYCDFAGLPDKLDPHHTSSERIKAKQVQASMFLPT